MMGFFWKKMVIFCCLYYVSVAFLCSQTQIKPADGFVKLSDTFCWPRRDNRCLWSVQAIIPSPSHVIITFPPPTSSPCVMSATFKCHQLFSSAFKSWQGFVFVHGTGHVVCTLWVQQVFKYRTDIFFSYSEDPSEFLQNLSRVWY